MSAAGSTTREMAAFDKCWELYQALCEECFVKGHICATDAEALKENRWKPDVKAKAEDFIADFKLAGKSALAGEALHSRAVLFETYYCAGGEYSQALLNHLGLSELGWVQWTEQIRQVVGRELMRREIFPPKKYFEAFARDGRKG